MQAPTFLTLAVEVKEGDHWRPGPGFLEGEEYEPPFISRDLALFGFLAGVRSPTPPALAGPRGMPDDVTDEVRSVSEDEDGHTHSWYGVNELLEGIHSLEMSDWARRFPDLEGEDLEAAMMASALKSGIARRFPEFQGFLRRLPTPARLVFWFQGPGGEADRIKVSSGQELRDVLYDHLTLQRYRGFEEFFDLMDRIAVGLGPAGKDHLVEVSLEQDPWLKASLGVLVGAYGRRFPGVMDDALGQLDEVIRVRITDWLRQYR